MGHFLAPDDCPAAFVWFNLEEVFFFFFSEVVFHSAMLIAMDRNDDTRARFGFNSFRQKNEKWNSFLWEFGFWGVSGGKTSFVLYSKYILYSLFLFDKIVSNLWEEVQLAVFLLIKGFVMIYYRS